MSNKPKNHARIYPHVLETREERKHKHLVREAKKQGHRHAGSKTLKCLSLIKPTKFTEITNSVFSRLFKK